MGHFNPGLKVSRRGDLERRSPYGGCHSYPGLANNETFGEIGVRYWRCQDLKSRTVPTSVAFLRRSVRVLHLRRNNSPRTRAACSASTRHLGGRYRCRCRDAIAIVCGGVKIEQGWGGHQQDSAPRREGKRANMLTFRNNSNRLSCRALHTMPLLVPKIALG